MSEHDNEGASNSNVNTKVDLRGDGVLWMLNTTVFHPRGLALSVTPEGELYLQGDGDEVWVFREDTAEGAFERFNELLERHLSKFDD